MWMSMILQHVTLSVHPAAAKYGVRHFNLRNPLELSRFHAPESRCAFLDAYSLIQFSPNSRFRSGIQAGGTR